MILKKNWFSYFTWGVFTAFFAVVLGMFWYFSGIIPDESAIPLTIAMTALTVVAVFLIAFAAGRLVEFLRPRLDPDPAFLQILGDLTAGVLFLIIFIVRILYISKGIDNITDAEGLFGGAMIKSGEGRIQTDILSIMTTGLLRFFLRISGNRIAAAAVIMAAVQVGAFVAVYLAVRLLTGKVAALTSAALMGFLPVYLPQLLNVGNDTMFFLLFGLELLVVAIYIHLDVKDAYTSPAFIPWFAALGIIMGFMAYVDLATIILWIPLLLTLLIPGKDKAGQAGRLCIILLVSAIMHTVILVLENGIANAGANIAAYFAKYFKETNTVVIFHLPVEKYPLYIAVVTFMALTVVMFWRDARKDRTSMWFLMFLAEILIVPMLGRTRLNSQDMLFFCYSVIIGTGVTCLVAPVRKKVEKRVRRRVEVPEGMVLPQGYDGDEGESHMWSPVYNDGQYIEPLGLDRGEEAIPVAGGPDAQIGTGYPGVMPGAEQEGEIMANADDGLNVMMAEGVPVGAPGGAPVLSKAEQKALAKARKAQAKAEAKAAKAAAKAAKKAEHGKFSIFDDDDDEDEEDIIPTAMPVQAEPVQAAPVVAAAAAATVAAAATAATASAVQQHSQHSHMPEGLPSVEDMMSPQEKAREAGSQMQIQAQNAAPVTTRPNVTRNSFAASDGDDFDFDINTEDDFDI